MKKLLTILALALGVSVNAQTGNTATGAVALQDNTTGDYNIATGTEALPSNTEGNHNIALGREALKANLTGSGNIGLGYKSGDTLTTGSNNVVIGYTADTSANNATNQIVIGEGSIGHGNDIVVFGNSNITAWHPGDDNGVDLGSTSYSFKDAHIQGVIYGNFTVQEDEFTPLSKVSSIYSCVKPKL